MGTLDEKIQRMLNFLQMKDWKEAIGACKELLGHELPPQTEFPVCCYYAVAIWQEYKFRDKSKSGAGLSDREFKEVTKSLVLWTRAKYLYEHELSPEEKEANITSACINRQYRTLGHILPMD